MFFEDLLKSTSWNLLMVKEHWKSFDADAVIDTAATSQIWSIWWRFWNRYFHHDSGRRAGLLHPLPLLIYSLTDLLWLFERTAIRYHHTLCFIWHVDSKALSSKRGSAYIANLLQELLLSEGMWIRMMQTIVFLLLGKQSAGTITLICTIYQRGSGIQRRHEDSNL